MQSNWGWILSGFLVGGALVFFWPVPSTAPPPLDAKEALRIASGSDCARKGVLEDDDARPGPGNVWLVGLSVKPGEIGDECRAFCEVNEETWAVHYRERCSNIPDS